jgi:predicted amidohydrolase
MPTTTLATANVRIEHDKSRNLGKFVDMIDEAAAKGADILVLPEVGLQGYADLAFALGNAGSVAQKQYYYREAETIPGPATDVIAAKAAEHGMYIQLGLAERAVRGDVILNAAAVIGPEGVVNVYRKTHNQFEFPYFSPGQELPVFDLPFARTGSLICYDLAFPEVMRTFALKGANLALKSTAWPMKGHDRETDYHGYSHDLAARANAFFNQMWLVTSNHCEKGAYSAGVDYWGRSQIVDPFGKVVAALDDEEGVVVHTADLEAEVVRSRTNGFFGLNLVQDRRPDLYEELARTDLYGKSDSSRITDADPA